MSRKAMSLSLVVVFCISVYFTGCAQDAQLALKFAPEESVVYKISTQTKQSYKFDQPSIKKIKEENTGTAIDMTLRQQVQSVDQKGGAVNLITIEAIKMTLRDKTGVKLDYDSAREADKGKPLSKLLGKSYRVHIAPDGKATIVDAKEVRATLKSGFEGRIAEGLFSDKSIEDRHEILALPDTEMSTLSVGDSWKRIKGSHPKLLDPKSFEKTYTLTSVKTKDGSNIATVDMTAIESAVAAEDAPKSRGLGIFGNLFDAEETLTGRMTLDLDTGKVLNYSETLVGKYVAIDPTQAESTEKQPDSLTMGFIHEVTVELVE